MSERTATSSSTYLSTSGEVNQLRVSGEIDPAQTITELLLPDGRTVRVATTLLTGGSAQRTESSVDLDDLHAVGEEVTIPVIEEAVTVGKRVVETGKIRLEKTVEEYQEALNEPLAVRTFDIERIALNQPVESAPEIRQEGDTTIYPLVEERLVITKQLLLTEEIRVTKHNTERIDDQVVTLRREHLNVERVPAGGQE